MGGHHELARVKYVVSSTDIRISFEQLWESPATTPPLASAKLSDAQVAINGNWRIHDCNTRTRRQQQRDDSLSTGSVTTCPLGRTRARFYDSTRPVAFHLRYDQLLWQQLFSAPCLRWSKISVVCFWKDSGRTPDRSS